MNWSDLPNKLKVLIIIVTGIGVPILLQAVSQLFYLQADINWVILTVLAVLTVPFFLFLPSVNSIIGIGDAYIMAIAMLYGPAPCVLATFFHTLSASLFVPNRPKVYFHRVLLNTSSMVCGAWIYSNLYRLLNPTLSHDLKHIVLPAAFLTIVFFLFNSLIISTAIAWSSEKRVLAFWVANCLPLWIDFSVSSVSATIIVALQYFSSFAPLAVAPLIGVVWGWNKIVNARAIEAEHHLKEQEQLYMRTVESLALAVDAKDQTTYGHIRRVRAYAMGLAKLCNITNSQELMAIETGSLLHDIGKLAVEDYILNKPGKLSAKEFEKMKMHSAAGDQILQQIQFPFPVSRYVRFHHERWDGKGYPDGLKAEDIPLGARILSISDAFDAIRSSRPYKSSFGVQDSVELLKAQSGVIYDPKLVELFTSHIEELVAAAEKAGQSAPELSFRKYFAKVDSELSDESKVSSHSLTHTASTELVRIFEFCSSLGKQLDLHDILHILSRRIKQLVPYSTCAIYLDNANDALKAEYVCGKHSDYLQNAIIGLGKGISGWAAAYKRPMLNTGPSWEFRDIEGDFTDLTDILVVPLLNDSDCIGTISLYAGSTIEYSQSQLALLQAAAGLVAPLLSEVLSRRESTASSALIDPVTRAYRVSHLSISGSQLLDSAKKNESPLSLICLEIRNYRQLVRLYGIGTGDSILRQVSSALQSELREMDVLVRFGQQGFVVLLPGVRKDQATRYAHRLQQQLRNMPSLAATVQPVTVDCQVGLAAYPDDGTTIFVLLQHAQISLAEHAKLATSPQSDSDDNIVEFPPRI